MSFSQVPSPAQLDAVLAQLQRYFDYAGRVGRVPLPPAWHTSDPGLLRLCLPTALRREPPYRVSMVADDYGSVYCPPASLDLRVRCSLPVPVPPPNCVRAGYWHLAEEVLVAPAHAWLLLLPTEPLAPPVGIVVLTGQLLAWLRHAPSPNCLTYFGTCVDGGYLTPANLAAGLPAAPTDYRSLNDWTQLRYC